MTTNTRAELAVFDCSLRDGGLEEFEPEPEPEPQPEAEAERGGLWLRVPSPTAADVQQWDRRAQPHRPRAWPLVAPVVIAAAVAGAAVSWIGLRDGDRLAPPPPRAAVSTETPRVVPSVVAPPAAAEAITAVPGSAPVPAPPIATEPAPVPRDPALDQTLASVSRAYRALDAAAVAAVLPNIDAASLTQEFSALKYQTLSFDHCALRPNGAESTIASCDVSLAMAPNTGDAALQRRHEAWTLVLNWSGEGWRIAAVTRP